ncbi:Ricin-type beta-trefoil lectin domain protein [Streptomyces netropsis]|uniref:Ricin B lectin domain-containing protein n=1 Tax=Streptomyces syringium TaxID=76729 RepID=A0ABS4Y5N4_9ACTN|nr:RICIN domain-containing protein [Streptomyces syringium]MBP2404087.1 hypothetical protein [Streptomyces syringium]SPE53724.1 Ricin-type beta-trefoil lectin domain protein [Streptomyces netropsis]
MPKLRAHVEGDEYIEVEVPDEAVITLAGHPDLTFDVAGASKEAGAPVILWKLHRGDNQRWRIHQPDRYGWFHLVNVHSGLCLTLADGTDGAPVTQAAVVDNDRSQKWWLRQVKGGYHIANGTLRRIAPEAAASGKPLKGLHGSAEDDSWTWVFTAA